MDPNLFYVDWEQLSEVLIAIIVLSFFVERALALVFEHRLFVARFSEKGLKEPIAFLTAFMICRNWDFDALSTIILAEQTQLLGQAVTAGVIAGGSKASIKLFHDLMGVKSTAKKEAEVAKEEKDTEATKKKQVESQQKDTDAAAAKEKERLQKELLEKV